MSDLLFGRRASLTLVAGDKALDLSEFRFRFSTQADDEESPNNANIRVYNLSPSLIKSIKGEFSRVRVQAGYGDNFGLIFEGSIRQYRIGRENMTDTYLDILAADGDEAYNFAMVSQSMAAGSTGMDRIQAVILAMKKQGVDLGKVVVPDFGGTNPRGKVLWGLGKQLMRDEVRSVEATWSIQNGKVNIIALDKYLPGQAVVLTSSTGLIGRPEQTQDGIMAKCLLNPKIEVGGLVKIDNASINQTSFVNNGFESSQGIPYNTWGNGYKMLADVSSDGVYRVFVAEHEGDTRGTPFYTNLTLLAVDQVTETCKAYP
jgi:hypothetical protein